MDSFSPTKRDEYWKSFALKTSEGDFMYHLAGADKNVQGISIKHVMHYLYRFAYEDVLLSRLINMYCTHFNWALDAGCGTGRSTLVLKKALDHVDAFDISPNMIRENQKRFNESDITFFVSSFSEVGKSNVKYDAIFIGGVLMCMDDEEALDALIRAKNLLYKNGVVIVRDTVSKGETFMASDVKKIRSFNDEMALLQSTGFTVVRTYNGANRSVVLSMFSRLPIFLQERKFIQKTVSRLLAFDARTSVGSELRSSKFLRHSLTNQVYFVLSL